MKIFLTIFALCCVGALAGITREKKEVYRAGCKIGVSDEAIKNAYEGKVDVTDEKLACYFACLMKKTGVMNLDGTINEEKGYAIFPFYVPKDKAAEAAKKCIVIKGASECNTAIQIMKCARESKLFEVLY